jgi:UDP-2,4-diacetamido-2,4,6-trideoxy-beta-L-altropyranose hydrolase
MRCLALAQEVISRGGKALFIGDVPESVEARIRDEGLDFVRTSRANEEALFDSVLQHHVSTSLGGWVVLDGYRFDLQVQRAAVRFGHRLLVIDDTAHLPRYEADVVLNQNINADALQYESLGAGHVLRGPRFALLRSAFRGLANLEHWDEEVCRLLVTMGGSDPTCTTEKVLDAVEMLDRAGLEVRVILGPASPRWASIEERLKRLAVGLGVVHWELGTAEIAEHVAWANLAVSAAGTTSWELLCAGVPALLIVVAVNQRPNATGLAELGCVEVREETVTAATIAECITLLRLDANRRRTLRERGLALVDGYGSQRVVDTLVGLDRRRAATPEAFEEIRS